MWAYDPYGQIGDPVPSLRTLALFLLLLTSQPHGA